MGARLTGAVVGVIFGVTLSWTGMSSPDVIREALLFENAYLFLFFGSAVVTAFVGLRMLRAVREGAAQARHARRQRPVRHRLGRL